MSTPIGKMGDFSFRAVEVLRTLYDFVVLLDRTGVGSEEVWAEMNRRREAFGIAAKLPKPSMGDS